MRTAAMSKREQDRRTREFTNKLATFAKLMGGEIRHPNDRVVVSGNGGDDDSAFVFTIFFTEPSISFNVEVFGDGS